MAEIITKTFDIWTTAQALKTSNRGRSASNQSLLGIKKLRELILELAIRGKLVPQDSKDEPANVFLDKIGKENRMLIKEGKIKGQKLLPVINENKIPFRLPDGWVWAWFSQMYFFQEGPGIRNWQFRSEGIKLLNVQNIVDGKLVLEKSDKYIDPIEYQQKYLHFTIEENDLLFASSGGSWGKTAFFTDPGYKVIVNTSTIRLKPHHKDCSRNFMRNIVDSVLFKDQMVEQLVGMQPNFGSTHLLKVIIPVPPCNEQVRIADKVDELMALCDQLEQQQTESNAAHETLVEVLLGTLTNADSPAEFDESWQRISAHFDTLFTTEHSIDQLKQTILQLAVMGKLTPQNPEDEPASELLKKIAKEKARLVKEGVIKKQAPLAVITEEEKPFELPRGWEWVRLNDAIDVRDGTHDTPKDAAGENTYPLVTSKNFENGNIKFDDAKRISAEDHFEISKRSNVERYDILFSMIGGNLGNQVMVNDNRPFSIKNVALFKYYNKDYTSPLFVKKIMEHIAIDLQNKAIGGAQPFVSLGFLRNLIVALPPVAEQHRIVSKVDELVALCDALKERINQAQTTQNQLAEAVVKQTLG